MIQITPQPLDEATRRKIAQQNLSKALLKSSGRIGNIIYQMVYEVAADEANVQDKAKLEAMLQALMSNQEEQHTDLGDILSRGYVKGFL